MQPRGEGARILATPFARRLARQGGIDLRNLNGTGPRGRIKAADVERVIAAGRSAIASPAAAAVTDQSRAAVFSAGVEIDVTALLALNEQINNELPDLHADLAHYVVLAAAKITDVFREPPVIGFASRGEGGAGAVSVIAGAECRTLRSVVAQIASSAAASEALRSRAARFGSNARWTAFPSSRPIRRTVGRRRSLSARCATPFGPMPTAGRFAPRSSILC